MNKKFDDVHEKIHEVLFNVLPFVFYKNSAGIYLGGNDNQAKAFGFDDTSGFVGKNIYEILNDEEAARQIDLTDKQIMQNGLPSILEEAIGTPYGEKIFLTQKEPIFNADGIVVGMIGFAMDITEIKARQRQVEIEKEKIQQEKHRLEIGYYKQLAEQQELFQKAASQVAHDIRSPLSTMLMTLKVCLDIPEAQRVTLRAAATRINDIANNLIGSFRKKDGLDNSGTEQREPILVSSALLEILAEKKYQYQDRALKLDHQFSPAGNFAWISIKPTSLKRMMSNLINNAVDAFDGKPGRVTVEIDTNGVQVYIAVKDNGKGMSPQLLHKIKNKISVSEGKSEGHGIGMTQIHDTLDENDGKMDIHSVVGLGTQIILTFPSVAAQNWIADSIQLYDDDTVVVLDDDDSIHQAWDFRFELLQKAHPNLTVIHHHIGQDTIDYVNQLTPEQKDKFFLLSDYELLHQGMNGLQVIAKVEISRSTLVTSYYADRTIQMKAGQTGTRILPKQLAAEVPIKIDKRTSVNAIAISSVVEPKAIDAVFVDDDQLLLSSYKSFAGTKWVIETYSDPKEFIEKVECYPKHTKVFLDQNYSNYDKKGEHLAEHLRAMGYTRLYLLTGDQALRDQVPEHLNVLIKSDLETLFAALED